MAATPVANVAEEYQTALAGYLLNADWFEPFNALKARLAVNFLNKLSVLTPAMAAVDEEKGAFDLEELRELRREARMAGARRGRVTAFENPVSLP